MATLVLGKKKNTKLKKKAHLIKSGNRFIETFVTLLQSVNVSKEIRSEYLQKVLHSIFFFGYINNPPIPPEAFIPSDKLEYFKNRFPQPFDEYCTHVPLQAPYSILLEFIVENLQYTDPESLRNRLLAVNISLQKLSEKPANQAVANDFTASVIAHSDYKDANDKVLKTAHGSSISCKGLAQRRIMIHISVLHVWAKAISYAVCQEGDSPSIVFPNQVHCKAYRFDQKNKVFKELPPCSNCNKTFPNVKFNPVGLTIDKDETWPYGNCAEYESISKLISGCQDLRNSISTEIDKDGSKMDITQIEDTFRRRSEEIQSAKLKELLDSRNIRIQERPLLFQIDMGD
ncbi:uncharacterized protein LOC134612332 [Pelobates fuscus]|uniref:uncharacterized protein LOC134612332 n=1 Tax=Pelobates fuscus TaxID=191477 RepID=UPI002FE49C04